MVQEADVVVEDRIALTVVLEAVVLPMVVDCSELIEEREAVDERLVEVVIEEETLRVDVTAALVVLDNGVDKVVEALEVVCGIALVVKLAEAVVGDEYCTEDVVADVEELDAGSVLVIVDKMEDDVSAGVEIIDDAEVGALSM